jgi:metal-sulfur cluster biosynthetic enzyme
MVTTHMSGGRDLWSAPLGEAPSDRVKGAWDLLQEVLDPEIPISLTELGLIYDVAYHEGVARIDLTFTATACQCMDFIREDITDRLTSEHWIDRVELVEVWDPPWTSDRITPKGREKLKEMGVIA